MFSDFCSLQGEEHTRQMEFSFQWPSDQGDNMFSLFNQSEINSLSAYFHDSHIYSMEPATGLVAERPPNSSSSIKTEQAHAAATPSPPPLQRNISFGKAVLLELKPEMEPIIGTSHGAEWNFGALSIEGPENKVVRGTRAVSCTSEHVIAERNRREKLSQLFIALSAIIPNLKKNDKVSLLSGAINFVKQLETKVKTLEQQGSSCRQDTEEPTADHHLVNNSQLLSSPETIAVSSNFPVSVLKIEARLTEKTVLLRILCERSKGVLVKVLSEIEKLRLSVLSISSMPSDGSTTLNITVVSNVTGVQRIFGLKDNSIQQQIRQNTSWSWIETLQDGVKAPRADTWEDIRFEMEILSGIGDIR